MPFAGTPAGEAAARRRLEAVARNLSLVDEAAKPKQKVQPGSKQPSHHGQRGASSSSSTPGAFGTSAEVSFDFDLMHAFLFPDHRNLRAKVREFISTSPAFTKKPDLSEGVKKQREWCQKACEALINERFVSLLDLKRDAYKYFAFFESLYLADASVAVKLSTHFNHFGVYVLNVGTERHKKLLPDIDRGAIFGGFAMTELGHGSNVRELETTAWYDKASQEFVINTPSFAAQKFWAGNALTSTMAVVFARLFVDGEKQGVHAFVVPFRAANGAVLPGIEIVDCGLKQGLNGVDNGKIRFRDVRIPRENLLNRIGDVESTGEYTTTIPIEKRFTFHIAELVVARMVTAGIANSLTTMGLNIALHYASNRAQFGTRPQDEELLINYLSHQRRLFPHLATLYALTFFTSHCKRQYDHRTEATLKEFHVLIAGLKVACTTGAREALQSARESCGGQGYLASNLISQLRVDADALLTHDGDNHVLLQQVAHGALGTLLNEMDAHRVKSTLTYIGKETASKIKEKNPIAIRQSSEVHLMNHEFHLAAFRYRESRQSYLLAKRLTQMTSRLKYPFFTAWNESTVEVNALAQAHIERVVLEQFVYAVDNLKVPELRRPLDMLVSLYALTRIEADSWFLSSGYISALKHDAVTKFINTLCTQLQPFALGLINAFKVPVGAWENTVASGIDSVYGENDANWNTLKENFDSRFEREPHNSSWDLA